MVSTPRGFCLAMVLALEACSACVHAVTHPFRSGAHPTQVSMHVHIYDARDPDAIVNHLNKKLLQTGAFSLHASTPGFMSPSLLVTRGA